MAKTQHSLSVGEAPTLEVEVAGDLRLAGWDEPVVLAQADEESPVELAEQDGVVRLTCAGDCLLQVPRASRVRLVVRGDAAVKDIAGAVTAPEVSGDLMVRRVGPCEIGSVAGDLSVKDVTGDVSAGSVAGDARFADIAGSVTAGSVAADLAVRGVTGGLEAVCGADATVAIQPKPGQRYAVTAGADIQCRLAAEASATLELISGTGDVKVRVPGAKASNGGFGAGQVVIGEGGPVVALTAGADILVVSEGGDGRDGVDRRAIEVDMARMAADLEAQMSQMAAHIAASLHGAGLSEAEAGRVAERVRHANERAVHHAQHHVERAQRHAQRHAERAARHAERHRGRSWTWRWGAGGEPRPGGPARPAASSPATAAERESVLKMLSERRITADEARALLDALEGK